MAEGEGGGSSLRAGGAYVELLLKDDAYGPGLDKARARLDDFAGSVKVASAAMGTLPTGQMNADLVETVKSAHDAAKAMKELQTAAAAASKVKPIEVKVAHVPAAGEHLPNAPQVGKDSLRAPRLPAPRSHAASAAFGAGLGASAVDGLRATQGAADSAGASLMGLGGKVEFVSGLLGGSLLAAVVAFNQAGNDVADGAARMGIGVEAYQSLAFAATLSGTSIEKLEPAMRKMGNVIAHAAAGGKQAKDVLRGIGLSAAELAGLSPDEQYKRIADALAKIPDRGKRAAAATALFGEASGDLLPMLSQGRAGIEALQKEAEALGVVMSADAVKQAEELGDAFDKLWAVAKGAAVGIGGALAPSIMQVVEWSTKAAGGVATWVQENRDLVVQGAQLVALGSAIGVGMLVAGAAIAGVGTVLGATATIVSVTVASVGAATGAVLSPLGLLVVGLGAATAAFLYLTDAGGEVRGVVADAFGSFTGEASKAFGTILADGQAAFEGIWAAVSGGDMSLALSIAGKSLELLWADMKGPAAEAWSFVAGMGIDFIAGLAGSAASLGLSIADSLEYGFRMAFAKGTEFAIDFVAGLQRFFATAASFLEQSMMNSILDANVLLHDLSGGMTGMSREVVATLKANIKASYANGGAAVSKGIEDERLKARAELDASGESSVAIDREFEGRKGQNDTAAKVVEDQTKAFLEGMLKLDPGDAEAVAKLRQEVTELVDKAKRLGEENARQKGEDVAGAVNPSGEPGGATKAIDAKLSSSGAFNAAALRGLGGGEVAERTARAAEKTAKNTADLTIAVRENGAVFV